MRTGALGGTGLASGTNALLSEERISRGSSAVAAVARLFRGVSQYPGGSWTPRELFANGEQGAWYDPSDITTLFQDSGGTVPVTELGQPIGRVLDKSGRGRHLTQATASARPVWRQDQATGAYFLQFDGVDDTLLSEVIPFANVNATSWVATEHTGGTVWADVWQASNFGSGFWAIGQSGSTTLPHQLTGVGSPVYSVNAVALSPVTRGELFTRQINKKTIVTTTGLVLATDALRVSGYTGAIVNGRFFSIIVRGASSSREELSLAEHWIAQRSGINLP